MKKTSIIAASLSFLLLTSCAKIEQKWVNYSLNYEFIFPNEGDPVTPFNTVMGLAFVSNDLDEKEEENFKKIFRNKSIELHKYFDRHYDYLQNDKLVTNIKTINDSYGSGEKIYCSDELYTLLKKGVEMTQLTKGYFNFFIGNLTDFWDEIFDKYANEEDLKDFDPRLNNSQRNALNRYVKSSLSLEEAQNALTFNDIEKSVIFNAVDDIKYDNIVLERSKVDSIYRPVISAGGIAKGLATDYLKEELNKNGLTKGFLNSGTSSISSLSDTSYIDKGYQTINLTDPRGAEFMRVNAYSFDLYGEYNLSTSGVYSSNKAYSFVDDDKLVYRHHIVNPKDGECSQYHQSVTLISTTYTSGDLDALSTAFVNLSKDDGFSFRKELLEGTENNLSILYVDLESGKLNLYATSDMKEKVRVLNGVENAAIIYE